MTDNTLQTPSPDAALHALRDAIAQAQEATSKAEFYAEQAQSKAADARQALAAASRLARMLQYPAARPAQQAGAPGPITLRASMPPPQARAVSIGHIAGSAATPAPIILRHGAENQ